MDVKSNDIIEMSGPNNPKIDTHNDIYVISNFDVTGRAAGDPRPAGGKADLKSNDIIEFSGPNNPKFDTHNHISVIFFEF